MAEDPRRFFRPPCVASGGWIGLRRATPGLRRDVSLDWDEVAAICEDADRCAAPPKLFARLSGSAPPRISLIRALHTHALRIHTQRRLDRRRRATRQLEPAAHRLHLAARTCTSMRTQP